MLSRKSCVCTSLFRLALRYLYGMDENCDIFIYGMDGKDLYSFANSIDVQF